MKGNLDYILKNFDYGGNKVDWLMCIENFFGKEKAEEFADYFISFHHIMRKGDIRKLIRTHPMSVYSCMNQERLAIFSIYQPFGKSSKIMQNLDSSAEKVQNLYRKKDKELAQKIKKLGYSYVTTFANWKAKDEKDTYQREYVFVIFSEEQSEETFVEEITALCQEYSISKVLITEQIQDNAPKLQIASKVYDTKTKDIIQQAEDTVQETIEQYLTNLYGTKVMFHIPYENKKQVLWKEDEPIFDYYSKTKQEIIQNRKSQGFQMGMVRASLLQAFQNEKYNE